MGSCCDWRHHRPPAALVRRRNRRHSRPAVARGEVATTLPVQADWVGISSRQVSLTTRSTSHRIPYLSSGHCQPLPAGCAYLLVPTGSLLPTAAFWIVPLAVIAASLYRLAGSVDMAIPGSRPPSVAVRSTPVVPIALVRQHTPVDVGRPVRCHRIPTGHAWAVVFKPNAFPLALPFALRSWRGFVGTVLLSCEFCCRWFDWITVIRNANTQTRCVLRGGLPALATPLVDSAGPN